MNYVKESKGKSVMVPDAFIEGFKEVLDLQKEYDDMILVLSKKEITMATKVQELMLKVRTHVDETRPENWRENIGINTDAAKEGVYVINFTSGQQR